MRTVKKSYFVVVSLLQICLSVLLTAQAWFSFEMNMNDDQLQLQSFDGFSAFAFVGPILAVVATAIVLMPLTGRSAIKPLLAGAGAFSILLSVLLVWALLSQDLSGLASELETATGIAQAHGLQGAKVSLLWPAFATPIALTSLSVFIWAGFFMSAGWTERKTAPVQKKTHPSDSIGLWDSQR